MVGPEVNEPWDWDGAKPEPKPEVTGSIGLEGNRPMNLLISIPPVRSVLHIGGPIQVETSKNPPNWWWRFWYWALLGWTWRKL
jgi:hypothetical protein